MPTTISRRSHRPKHLDFSRLPTKIRHKPKHSIFTGLPTEIRHQILSYLLVSDSPINLAGVHDFSVDPVHQDTLQRLTAVDLDPEGYCFFYSRNTFLISDTQIPAFLEYRPLPSECTGTAGTELLLSDSETATPRYHITNLIISIQPIVHPSHNPGSALQEILSCPHLKALEIQLNTFMESAAEVDPLFGKIKNICLLLGEKLGEENLKVGGNHWRAYFTWTMTNFREGKFEGSKIWR
ncbi:MAG: hypothetical protein Q9199_000786 [Rusavskia elegans]